MKAIRTNYKAMTLGQFTSHLQHKNTEFVSLHTTTQMGKDVIEVTPNATLMIPRVFNKDDGRQLDPRTPLTYIHKGPKVNDFIKLLDEKIENMATPGVYYPGRLLPRWRALKYNHEKLELYKQYMMHKSSTMGFRKLVQANFPEETLEAVLLENPKYIELFDSRLIGSRSISKFLFHQNGVLFVRKHKGGGLVLCY